MRRNKSVKQGYPCFKERQYGPLNIAAYCAINLHHHGCSELVPVQWNHRVTLKSLLNCRFPIMRLSNDWGSSPPITTHPMKAAVVLKTLDHGSPSESHCDYSCQGLDRVIIELQWNLYCTHPEPIQCSRLNYPTTWAAYWLQLISLNQMKRIICDRLQSHLPCTKIPPATSRDLV